MGDSMKPAVERIDVQLSGIGEVIKTKRVVVPPYQRLYAWTEEEVTDLFRDLADAIRKNESEYFLGTIVLTRGVDDFQSIIDGQQRLITITLLIAAIRDYFFEQDDKGRADTLHTDFLSKRDLATQDYIPHIRLNPQDHEFYCNKIVPFPSAERHGLRPSSTSQKLLDKAAAVAHTWVKQLASSTQTYREVLVNWITFIERKAKVIVVNVANEANAFTIFEVLNDRGLDLSIADLLKNFLFRLTEDRVDEAQNSWTKMTSFLDSLGERDVLKKGNEMYSRHLFVMSGLQNTV